jgi:lipopolysaccharide transport system ATP-binding protein
VDGQLMSRTVIQVEGLGKRYRIGQPKQPNALSHVIGDVLRAPARLLGGGLNPASAANGSASANGKKNVNGGSPYIWALKDVSFEVKEGEVVGLIGRNGAGKSTLLKILARVTRPTEGHAEIHGRVGSLLEVGTGFHPELTGRENVFMSGALLGMRVVEIRRKFDEIVAFSEVERFLDTPLKHYSSGMQMRLAFAVAAHLEPEILFIDEVLAVGDAAFQRKCLGKMDDISKQGRTIVFVSHNINAISVLCRSAILLEKGRVALQSDKVQDVLRRYASPAISAHTIDLSNHPNRTSPTVVFEEISITDEDRGATHCVPPGAKVVIHLKVRPPGLLRNPRISIGATNFRGERVFAIGTHVGGDAIPLIEGPTTIRVRFTVPPLVPGEYTLDIGFCDRAGTILDEIYGGAYLEILKDDYLSMIDPHTTHTGHVMVRSEWICKQNERAESGELISSADSKTDPSTPGGINER